VLAHERAHILRRDNLQTGVHMLVDTLFWFHPLVWWIGRRMIDERECACDEAVVDAGHTGRDYAAGILAVCRHCSGQHRLAGAISALSGNLPRRIRRIIGAAPPAALGFVKAMTLSVLAVAVFAVPVAAGAAKDERARRAAFLHDARVLGTADLRMSRAAGGPRRQVVVGARALRVENVSMPELIGLAYGVDPARIAGAEGLGVQRYDLRAEASGAFADPRRFDPAALRVVVSRLLGAHFNLELHVNKRCQAPCGAQAFTIRLR
jgi:bla regulator protein blaR1